MQRDLISGRWEAASRPDSRLRCVEAGRSSLDPSVWERSSRPSDSGDTSHEFSESEQSLSRPQKSFLPAHRARTLRRILAYSGATCSSAP
jgi:hypothetical protein